MIYRRFSSGSTRFPDRTPSRSGRPICLNVTASDLPWLLDTNVVIGLRDRDPEVRRRLSVLDGSAVISIITRVELEGGVYRDPAQVGQRRVRLDALLDDLPCLAFDEAAALEYRHIVSVAGYSRRKLLDRMIAAQAIVHRLTLVTANPADFKDCPGLDLAAW